MKKGAFSLNNLLVGTVRPPAESRSFGEPLTLHERPQPNTSCEISSKEQDQTYIELLGIKSHSGLAPKRTQNHSPIASEFPLLRNARVTPAPRIQGKNMNKYLDKYDPKCFKTRQNSTILQPNVCPYVCLLSGGWGVEMISPNCRESPQPDRFWQ